MYYTHYIYNICIIHIIYINNTCIIHYIIYIYIYICLYSYLSKKGMTWPGRAGFDREDDEWLRTEYVGTRWYRAPEAPIRWPAGTSWDECHW